jgi:hypothetical protein
MKIEYVGGKGRWRKRNVRVFQGSTDADGGEGLEGVC